MGYRTFAFVAVTGVTAFGAEPLLLGALIGALLGLAAALGAVAGVLLGLGAALGAVAGVLLGLGATLGAVAGVLLGLEGFGVATGALVLFALPASVAGALLASLLTINSAMASFGAFLGWVVCPSAIELLVLAF